MKTLIIVPTYNELENLPLLLKEIFSNAPATDVLIVDDNSPDGTGELADKMSAEDSRVHVLHRSGKLGLGTAYIAGFKYAIARGYDAAFEMDADFSHNPKDLQRLYEACKFQGGDVAVGSRYVRGGGNVNWPRDRILLSRGGSIYTRLITWMPVQDPTAGFVCYRKEVLETINLDQIQFVGYAFQIEVTYMAWRLGWKVDEVSIIFEDRFAGVSKMSYRIVYEAVWRVPWLALRGKVKGRYGRKCDPANSPVS